MKHNIFWISLLIAAMLLTGCQPAVEMEPTAEPTATPTAAPTTAPTTTPTTAPTTAPTTVPTTAPTTAPTTEPTEPEVPMNIPNFTVYDEQGNTHKLSDFIGKPIVLNFWASWCGPCQGEMPDFNDAYLELGDEVVFLMINLTGSDSYQDAVSFIRQQGYQFPVYYDRQGRAGRAYEIKSIPTTIFIDAEGNIKNRWVGALSAELLEKFIGQIYTPETETGTETQ